MAAALIDDGKADGHDGGGIVATPFEIPRQLRHLISGTQRAGAAPPGLSIALNGPAAADHWAIKALYGGVSSNWRRPASRATESAPDMDPARSQKSSVNRAQ